MLLIAILYCCSIVTAFHVPRGLNIVRTTLSAAIEYPIYSSLNRKENPADNYDHILGQNDKSHVLSKLQEICRLRLQDIELSKLPVDKVSR